MKAIHPTLVLFAMYFILVTEGKTQIYTGGSFGFNYDNGYYVEAAPVLGYRYNMFDAGISPFLSYRERHNHPDYYSYGNRVFLQFAPISEVFAHAEFQVTNVEVVQHNLGKRKWIVGLPLGGGYRYRINRNMEAYGMILYDVLHDSNSPQQNPIVRGGVNYNL